MSFEKGVPIFAGNPAAGTRDERRLILDAMMIAAGAEPSTTGRYDDEPDENYTNLLEQPDTNGTSHIVVLDASTVVRGSLKDLLLESLIVEK